MREHGGVAVEGTAGTPEPLDELLEALGAYFGLAPGAFSAHVGPAGLGLEVARLSRGGAAARMAVNDHVARGDVAVFTAGTALELWTGGIVRALTAEVTGALSIESAWTTSAAQPLPEFRAETPPTS